MLNSEVLEIHYPLSSDNRVFVIFTRKPTIDEMEIFDSGMILLKKSLGLIGARMLTACTVHPTALINPLDSSCTACKSVSTRKRNKPKPNGVTGEQTTHVE